MRPRGRQRPTAADEIPLHLREMDPERYRHVAVEVFRQRPGETFAAAFAVWRAWQREAQDWQADRGLVWGMKGYRRQLGPDGPPVAWVIDTFGTPPPDWGDDPLRF